MPGQVFYKNFASSSEPETIEIFWQYCYNSTVKRQYNSTVQQSVR